MRTVLARVLIDHLHRGGRIALGAVLELPEREFRTLLGLGAVEAVEAEVGAPVTAVTAVTATPAAVEAPAPVEAAAPAAPPAPSPAPTAARSRRRAAPEPDIAPAMKKTDLI